jgi:hypothetical protein
MISIHDHGDDDEENENKQELLLLPYETRLVYSFLQKEPAFIFNSQIEFMGTIMMLQIGF